MMSLISINVPITYWIIGGLALTNVVTATGWKITADHLKAEAIHHAQDVATFKTAQQIADTNAQAQRNALLLESKINADKADADYASLLAKYRSNLLRYTTNHSHTSQTDHHQLPPAQGSNGPSTSPDLSTAVVISNEDAQVCAVNTARLVAVHDWAVSLPQGAEP